MDNKNSKHKTDDKQDKKVSKEIEELNKKIEELENKYKRALADYQNLEKRVAEERKELIKSANKDLLLHLLPVLDTLKEAGKHADSEGLTLSVKQFEHVLQNEGIEKIVTEGKQFDPKLMRCIQTEEGQEGSVLNEMRPGYIYKGDGTLLRVADVIVGKKKKESQEEEKAQKELQKGDYM